jgi:pyruvate-formate lyase-activating enzyme
LIAPFVRRYLAQSNMVADRSMMLPSSWGAIHVGPGGLAFTEEPLEKLTICSGRMGVKSVVERESRSACDVTQFWQYGQCKSHPSNEPLITAEWAVAIFREAHKAGLLTGFVSNGNATPQVLRYLRPWLNLYKVDLKSFNDRHYRELGGRLGPILESIQLIHEMGFWLEVVTLVVPGFNDSSEELTSMAKFLAQISRDIPCHVIAFHKDYRMTSPENTSASALVRAAEIGRGAGLKFVCAGNLPGQVGAWEDTHCPECGATVIRRRGFSVLEYRIGAGGACPECRSRMPGIWASPTGNGHPIVHRLCG